MESQPQNLEFRNNPENSPMYLSHIAEINVETSMCRYTVGLQVYILV